MSENQGKTGGGPFILVTAEQFMQPTARQTPLHGLVKRRVPRDNRRTGFRRRKPFQRGDMPFEG